MTPRAKRLLRLYGITPEQEAKLLRLQGGKCALCRRPPKTRRLDVDHDHKTKRVRGALCHHCNRFHVGKNDAVSARAILQYLSSTFDARNL